jgi:pyrimidine-specific ribonucleoside hydrolase
VTKPARKLPVVVDTDPGVDDLLALALAACAPELDLIAVTTSYGNATLGATTRNARYLLHLAGRPEVPVVPGAAAPERRTAATAPIRHGTEGSGDAPVPPAEPVVPNAGALARVLEGVAEPVTVVTMGPLTNLAAALRTGAGPRVSRHIGMFGAVYNGSGGHAHADFNTWCDPEAADQVLRTGLPTTMVALDASRKLVLDPRVIRRAAQSRDPLASWLAAALSCAMRYDQGERGIQGVLVHDVVTVAYLLEPGTLTTQVMPIHVSLDEGEARGHTRVRADGIPTSVAVDVDVQRTMALIARVLPT